MSFDAATVLTYAGFNIITSLLSNTGGPLTIPNKGNWGTNTTNTAVQTGTGFTESGDETRQTATLTQETGSQTNDTFQAVFTQTCLTNPKTISEAMLWNTDGTPKIFMWATLGTGYTIPVQVNDQIQFTFQLKFT